MGIADAFSEAMKRGSLNAKELGIQNGGVDKGHVYQAPQVYVVIP
jgi:hypothetical protein